MKCVQNKQTEAVVRVRDEKAAFLTESGDWKYVPKSVWKERTRDAKK